MNKEDIDKAIKDLESIMFFLDDNSKIKKSYKLAIEALKAEPCDDAISRQAAIEAVRQSIRAEIEKVFCISVITDELRTPMEVKTEILQIIDKYKAESEEV